MSMKQYEMFELSFQGNIPLDSQVMVEVNAIFTQNGEEIAVKGFYAGNGIYKVTW